MVYVTFFFNVNSKHGSICLVKGTYLFFFFFLNSKRHMSIVLSIMIRKRHHIRWWMLKCKAAKCEGETQNVNNVVAF